MGSLEYAPQFPQERVAVPPLLLDHSAYTLVESRPLGSRQRFGRQHNDRGLLLRRLLLELFEYGKTVQTWHEQIQQDDVRLLLGHDLQGFVPIRGGQDFIRLAVEELAYQVNDLWVIVNHQEATLTGRDTGQGRQDRLSVKGFEQIIEGPKPIPQGFVVDNGEHKNRNIPGGRVRLQFVQELPAVFVRHDDVQDDGKGT